MLESTLTSPGGVVDQKLEALAQNIIGRLERLVLTNRWGFETALRTVLESDSVATHNLSLDEARSLESQVRDIWIDNSMARARSTRTSALASGLASGRIPPRKSVARSYSVRDRASGAEAEDRRDEIAEEFRQAEAARAQGAA